MVSFPRNSHTFKVGEPEHYIQCLQGTPRWLERLGLWSSTRRQLQKLRHCQHIPLSKYVRNSLAEYFPVTPELTINFYPTNEYLQLLSRVCEQLHQGVYHSPLELQIVQPSIFKEMKVLNFLLERVHSFASTEKKPALNTELKRLLQEEMADFFDQRGFQEFSYQHFIDYLTGSSAVRTVLPYCMRVHYRNWKARDILARDIYPFPVPSSTKYKEEVAVFCVEMYIPVFVAAVRLLRYILVQELGLYRASMFCLYYRYIDTHLLQDLVLARKYSDQLMRATLYHPRCTHVVRTAEEVAGSSLVVRGSLKRSDIEVYLCMHLIVTRQDRPAQFLQLFEANLRPFHRAGIDRDVDRDVENQPGLRVTLQRVLRRAPGDTLLALCRAFQKKKQVFWEEKTKLTNEKKNK